MAQLVEHHLAKVGVAGSNPVVRSIVYSGRLIRWPFFKCAPRLRAMRSAECFAACAKREARGACNEQHTQHGEMAKW